jgi:hypothetical protein
MLYIMYIVTNCMQYLIALTAVADALRAVIAADMLY